MRAIVVGRVADDPEISDTGPEMTRMSFRVVPECGEPSGRQGEQDRCPRRFEVEARDCDGDIARWNLAQGMRVLIEGMVLHYFFNGEGVTRELVTRVRLESMKVLSNVTPGSPKGRDRGAKLES